MELVLWGCMRGKKCFNTIWGKMCQHYTSKIFNRTVTADTQENRVTAKRFSICLVMGIHLITWTVQLIFSSFGVLLNWTLLCPRHLKNFKSKI